MEPIILVFIKLMGAAICGHWDLRDTGTSTRDYDTLVRSLGWLSGAGPGWQSHKNVTFWPVGHTWLPKYLRPVTAIDWHLKLRTWEVIQFNLHLKYQKVLFISF